MYNIAVFLGQLQLDSQRKVLDGIVNAARKDGNNIYVYSVTLTLDNLFNEGEYKIASVDDINAYDGYIIYAESIYSKEVRLDLINKLKKTNKPCASIDCYIEGMINVSSDNESAMRSLARHMIDVHGAKTINFIGGPDDSIDAVTRKKVVKEEIEKSGRILEERRIYTGDYYARSGRNAVWYYRDNGLLEADVYICANDQMALGAYYALSSLGINVPGDTLLTGYDDIFEAANHYPRITSVTRYEEKIGACAYKNIVKCISGKPYEKSPVIQSDIVCAESCGCSEGRPISHRVVVNKYAEKTLREARYAEMVSEFSADVAAVLTYDAMCDKLQQYVPLLGGDAFAVCFLENPDNITNVKLGMIYKDGEFDRGSKFTSSNMVDFFGNDEGGNLYVINSIHFGEKCYGYTIIRNSVMPTGSEFYRIFSIDLGNAVEHIDNYMKMQEMIKTLDEMWVFDPMTHVYNRAGFFKFADEMKEMARYKKADLFLILLDMDGLKKVNDSLGHEMGDALICDMADILRKCRDKEELLMRYGGDEFVIFGEGYNEQDLENYVQRIRRAMKEINDKNDRPYKIDSSIGYSVIKYDDDRPLSSLIEIADQNMYVEKKEKHKREKEKR